METKKTEVIGAITSAKDSAITYLENIKNTQVTEIEEVGKRLDDFNTDMVGLVSVHTTETKRKSDDGYNEQYNKISQYIINTTYDGADVHREGREKELKLIINKDKSVNNVSIPNVARVNKGSIKIPYKPLLWLKGGNIIDRYGLEPFDYHPDMFDSDGTFNYKTCKGQIMEDGFWYGIGTANKIPEANVSGHYSIDCINKTLSIKHPLTPIPNFLHLRTGDFFLEDSSPVVSLHDNYQKNIKSYMVNSGPDYEPSGYFFIGMSSPKFVEFNNIQSSKLCKFTIGGFTGYGNIKDLEVKIQAEFNTSISTPWVYSRREITKLRYRISEQFTHSTQAVLYYIFDKPNITKTEGNIHIVSCQTAEVNYPCNLIAIEFSEISKCMFKERNNIMVIYNGQVYLNGENVCQSAGSNLPTGIKDQIIDIIGYDYTMNTIVKELILFKDDNKSWNNDLCKMISKYGFSDEMVYSGNAPHTRIISDDACKIEGTLSSSKVFEPIQYLRDRNDIVKGNIYFATVNGKVIKVVAKESKAWVAGSEIPDASLVPYTIKSMKGGF